MCSELQLPVQRATSSFTCGVSTTHRQAVVVMMTRPMRRRTVASGVLLFNAFAPVSGPPVFDPYRSDPRYVDLMRRLDLVTPGGQ